MNTHIFTCDAHVHLSEFEEPLQEISEARKHGVKYIVGVGMDVESNKKVLKIASEIDHIIKGIGFHPWVIRPENMEENLEFLKTHVEQADCIGEVGLDYAIKVPKRLQIQVFERIVELTSYFEKPLIIHSRHSQERSLRILKELGAKRAIFHWYSGNLDILRDILDSGYHISVTPALAYSPKHQEAAKFTPLDRILLETDSPVEYQGVPSRIKDVIKTLELLSTIKGIQVEETAKITTKTFVEFFKIKEVLL